MADLLFWENQVLLIIEYILVIIIKFSSDHLESPMFVRLKQKPFYFLTDRDTKYSYLVDNRGSKSNKHLYYPDQFETMTSKEIRNYKWKLVYRFMWWGMFNKEQMTTTDKNICYSKIIDFGLTLATGLFFGSFFRRILFRIQFPFMEMALQRSIFSPRWVKTMFAYSIAGVTTYNAVSRIMKEQYLVDLAFEYRYNFQKSLTCKECDELLNKLCEERFSSAKSRVQETK